MTNEDLEEGIEAIRFLSEEIGPRPSASPEEAAAGLYLADRFQKLGLKPETEGFRSARSFGPAYLIIFGLATLACFAKRGPFRFLLGGVAAGLGIADGRFSRFGASALTKWRRSRNLHVSIEPSGPVEQTVCLVSHLDSSRSGLMFHPRVTPVLGKLVAATGAALVVQGLEPLVERGPGRSLVFMARALCALACGLVLEREVRGQNVAGANDNASGVGACLALATCLTAEPLERTRVVVLATGSEESGVIGMSEFLKRHDTEEWTFINFDGVSADASLRVLSKEGGPLGAVDADQELLRLATVVGERDPELKAVPLEHGSGLPYDATPVLVAGGHAISVVNQDGAIPDYHWPSDRFDHVSPDAFKRAVRFARVLLAEIDS